MKKTNNKENKNSFSNPLLEEVSKLVKNTLDIWKIQSLEQKIWFSNTILEIIKQDNKNRNLAIFLISELSSDFFKKFDNFHIDKEIVKLAILKDSSLFYSISSNLKTDPEIWFFTIQSMIREWRNFLEIEKFIDLFFPKSKSFLMKKYKLELNKSIDTLSNNLLRQIFDIKTSNIKFYEELISKKVIFIKWDKITFNDNYLLNLFFDLNELWEYKDLDHSDKNEYLYNYFINLFLLKKSKISSSEKYIIENLIWLIEKIESKQKVDNKNNDKNIEEIEYENNQILEEDFKDNIRDEFLDIAEFSIPDTNIQEYWDWYNINTLSWKKIYITNEEKDKFTIKSLSNFIKFYNIMYNLWLWFFWDKYKSDFKILCNNKFWFNYTSWEWVTDWKILWILNMIWKNVWVPESEFEDENWIKEIKCFKILSEAKSCFWEIKETWKINWKIYSDNTSFSNWAVENKLIEILCIDQKGNWLNISKWK